MTAYPTPTSLPVASDVNFDAGHTVPNVVVVEAVRSGSNQPLPRFHWTDVVLDAEGWFV